MDTSMFSILNAFFNNLLLTFPFIFQYTTTLIKMKCFTEFLKYYINAIEFQTTTVMQTLQTAEAFCIAVLAHIIFTFTCESINGVALNIYSSFWKYTMAQEWMINLNVVRAALTATTGINTVTPDYVESTEGSLQKKAFLELVWNDCFPSAIDGSFDEFTLSEDVDWRKAAVLLYKIHELSPTSEDLRKINVSLYLENVERELDWEILKTPDKHWLEWAVDAITYSKLLGTTHNMDLFEVTYKSVLSKLISENPHVFLQQGRLELFGLDPREAIDCQINSVQVPEPKPVCDAPKPPKPSANWSKYAYAAVMWFGLPVVTILIYHTRGPLGSPL